MSKHPHFKTLESSRPPFPAATTFECTQTPSPSWKVGSGATPHPHQQQTPATLSIDPYSPCRTSSDNYKLLVSGIVPRPIGFVSTVGKNQERNLAPFSYFSLANHDPPIFTLGFSSGTGVDKDSCRNLLAQGECTINIISEDFIEAANYTSLDAPPAVSEWELSGLTPAKSVVVAPPRVKESVFSVEVRLVHSMEWKSRTTGNKTGTLAVVEGVWFHVREDALKNGVLDMSVLKPVGRLGGISYSRTTGAWELPRPRFAEEKEKAEVRVVLEKAAQGKAEEGELKN